MTASSATTPDPERSPANRRRDYVRYGTASASSLSAALLAVVLNGQHDMRRGIEAIQSQTSTLSSSVAILQTAVERIQVTEATYQSADRVAHEAISARLSENDQRNSASGRDMSEVRQDVRDLSTRVSRLEHGAEMIPPVKPTVKRSPP